jgi:hypothetical protein
VSKALIAADDWPGVRQQWALANNSIRRQAASSKQLVGASGWQQGGSRVETLPAYWLAMRGVLLRCKPLTDGIWDDVLDVVEGFVGETVIKLTQEEKGIREDMVQTRKYILKRESRRCDRLEN